MKLRPLIQTLALLPLLLCSSLLYAETIWVDVRTSLEHMMDNIEGDTRITHTDILQKASEVFPDKTTKIKLYCRSGRRADIAMVALKEAGYTDVVNVGSIDDARRAREPDK